MNDVIFDTRWAYSLGSPSGTGELKVSPEDFIVTEELGYAPSEEGEHIFLWTEKQGLNTAFVAEALAKFTGLPLRQVTYAGRKDKHAITRQWFGLHAPKGLSVKVSDIKLAGFSVLAVHRHHKKLKVGQLKGNHFAINVTKFSDSEELQQRLQRVKNHGVPNYFGDQRFGVMRSSNGELQLGGTLDLGLRMLAGETIRNRNKRNLAISALRSAVFNSLVSARIERGWFNLVQLGDACALSGSNSFFIEHGDSLESSQRRYEEGDISPTAPLVGISKPSILADSASWEDEALKPYQRVIQLFTEQGISGTRRAIKIWPKALEWQQQNDKLHIQFSLPAGCFATSVLRECVQFQPANDSGND